MEVQFFMSKFKARERLEAAQAVEAGESVRSVSRRIGMSRQVVSQSVAQYREHGLSVFSNKRNTYSREEKVEVLNYMHKQHLSCAETGIKFGIRGSSTVWEWERRYMENGISGLEPKKKGRRPKGQKPKRELSQLEQLLAENERLRAENEYLKKLNALVAEREAREKHDKGTE
jgi:transposase